MVLTFPQFFQRLIGTSLQKSVNTARQNTLKSKKVVKFDSDLLKKNEDITLQSHTILQTVVWRGASLFRSPHKCL